MSSSIRYQGGQGVGLEAFGIRAPFRPDVRENQIIGAGFDRMGALAAQQQEQTQVAKFAEEGSTAALKRNPDGSLAPLELYEPDTAAGRAYNQAALTAYTTSTLLDADSYAKELAQKLDNDRETLPDGTMGARKSKDMVGDFEKAWTAYAGKTLGNMPDVLRAQIEPRLLKTGKEYGLAIAETQNEESVRAQLSTMQIAASRLARDAATMDAVGKTAQADQAEADFMAQLNAIQTIGGKRIDPVKIDEARQAFKISRQSMSAFRGVKAIFDAENAKGRDMEGRALATAGEWLDKQEIDPAARSAASQMVDAYARRVATSRAEAEAAQGLDFMRSQGASIARLSAVAEDKGASEAYRIASEEAAKARLPMEVQFWSAQASQYGARMAGERDPGAVAAQEAMYSTQIAALAAAPDFETFQKGLVEASASGWLGRGARQAQNVNAALSAFNQASAARARGRAALQAELGKAMPYAGKDGVDPSVDTSRLDTALNNLAYDGVDDGSGTKRKMWDISLEKPGTATQLVREFRFVPSRMASEMKAWNVSGGHGDTQADLRTAAELHQILRAESGNNLSTISAHDLSSMRETSRAILQAAQRHAVPQNASEEARKTANERLQRDIADAFRLARERNAETPEALEERKTHNAREMVRNFRVSGTTNLDSELEYAPGRGNATMDQIAADVLRKASGVRLWGNATLFEGTGYIDTTRWMKAGGYEIDMYEIANRAFSPIDSIAMWLGNNAKAVFDTKIDGQDAVDFWDRVWGGSKIVVSAQAAADAKGILGLNLAGDNLSVQERYFRSVDRVREEWGATQFTANARGGNLEMVRHPLEKVAGGFRPAQVMLIKHIEQNMPEGVLFYGQNIDPRVAVMRAGDVTARWVDQVADPNDGGKLKHVFRVTLHTADGRAHVMEKPMLVPSDMNERITNARRAGMEAEATAIRLARQENPRPAGLPSSAGIQAELGMMDTNQVKDLSVGDDFLPAERMRILRAGVHAAAKEMHRLYGPPASFQSIKRPAAAPRVASPVGDE